MIVCRARLLMTEKVVVMACWMQGLWKDKCGQPDCVGGMVNVGWLPLS